MKTKSRVVVLGVTMLLSSALTLGATPAAYADAVTGQGSATDTAADVAAALSDVEASLSAVTLATAEADAAQDVAQGQGFCNRGLTTPGTNADAASPTARDVFAAWAIHCESVASQSTTWCVQYYASSVPGWIDMPGCVTKNGNGTFDRSGVISNYCKAGTWWYRTRMTFYENLHNYSPVITHGVKYTCVNPSAPTSVDPS